MKARFLLLIAVLTISVLLHVGLGHGKFSRSDNANRLESFPLQVADWQGERALLQERVYRILETNAVIVNQYTRADEAVNLSIVHYPQMKVEFHPPEYCNSGKGDVVKGLGRRDIRLGINGEGGTLAVNVFTVTRGNGSQDLYYYFFKSGNFLSNSYFKLRVKMMVEYIKLEKTSGSLIILSTHIKNHIVSSESLLDKFAILIYPVLTQYI